MRRAEEKSAVIESCVGRPLPSGSREGSPGAAVFELRLRVSAGVGTVLWIEVPLFSKLCCL